MTLVEYAKDFFVWDKCSWLKRHPLTGKTIAKTTAQRYRSIVIRYILPRYGHFYLLEINPIDVENWIFTLQYSSALKSDILFIFKLILREAVREQLIEYNPLADIQPIPVKPEYIRSALTLDEIKQLFPCDEKEFKRIWRTTYNYTMFYTLLSTGMRGGEIRALTWQAVSFDAQAIVIHQAIKADNSIGTPKNGQSRAVFLSDRAALMLKDWYHITPYNEPGDLAFYGRKRNLRRARNLNIPFSKALTKAGIDRTNRNLDVHSLRHTFNTLVREVLPDEMLHFQIGHSNDKMTDHYDRAGVIEKLERFESERGKLEEAF